MTLETLMGEFPSIGPGRAKKLEKLGIFTVEDLLTAYPRGYEDRRTVYTIGAAPLGQRVCISAIAAEHPRFSRIRKGLDLVQVKVVDGGNTLHLTFFNQSYVQWAMKAGEEYVLCGTVEEQGRRRTMHNPIFEKVGEGQFTGRIIPIYRLTAGISNHMMTVLTGRGVEECAHLLPETLPHHILEEYQLMPKGEACRAVHYPETEEDEEGARRRLAFEELFYLTVGLSLLRERRQLGAGHGVSPRDRDVFLELLPFAPTGAQSRVMDQVMADLTSGQPMNRLVQGDVGSGKTVIAAFGAWMVAGSGGQTALMAPTEVLAEQHYRALSKLFAPQGIRVGLLSGGMSAPMKRKMKEGLARGEIDLIIGTHALISKDVIFHNLALVVADEQHRFGVQQRAQLSAKSEDVNGLTPHVLVMSATPIPRTLALMVYGDLEVSVMDELPPGRTPVLSYVVGESKRQRMYGFVRKQVEEGRQVYIICPTVEESEEENGAPTLKAVKGYAKELQEQIFPDLKVDFLHGKMRPREKEGVMALFADGETQRLVSTTVIEVGVDVANAALIVIENADRFGLSQLHQLRGRVGRGGHQSYCVLVTSTRNPDTMERLKTLCATTDGFKIAEEDLKLRGPGDFFGSRQHGLPQLRVADLVGDMRTLSLAQEAARQLVAQDPQLQREENAMVLERVRHLFVDTPDIFN